MSDRSEYVKVYDKKSKHERTVTKVAYKILAGRRYDLLEGDAAPPEVQKKSGVEPAAVSITDENGITETQGIKVIRKKPGPKPKNNAQE